MKGLSGKNGIMNEKREGIRRIKGITFPPLNPWAKQGNDFFLFLPPNGS